MNVISCSASMLLNAYSSHSHDCWELVYQLSGETRTVIGDESFTARVGSVWMIPPGVPHSGTSAEGFRDFAVKIKETDLPSFVLIKDTSGDILTMLTILQRVMTERDKEYALIADSLFDTVCTMVKKESCTPVGSPAVLRMKETLYRNIQNSDFRLSDAVAESGFDKDHFRRTFKRETGKTPLEYLTDLRITRAKQLLERRTDIAIKAVAESVGFADVLYFSVCFKKKVGVSPLAYKRSKNFSK